MTVLLGTRDENKGEAAAKEVHTRYTWDHNAARVVELARSLGRPTGVDR